MEIRVAAKTPGGSGLWAYSASPTTQWTSDQSDPLGDIDDAVNGIVSTTGMMPNTAVMSWDVWRALRIHPDILDRIKYTRPGAQAQTSDLNGWFGFSNVVVGTQLYDPAKEGQSSSPTYIWGDQMWIGYVPGQPSLMTPAAGYVLQWGDRQISRFRLDREHADEFEAGHFTAEIITASDAGAVIYNTV
jgi:hypothetical protein